jgi:hypothetical protein
MANHSSRHATKNKINTGSGFFWASIFTGNDTATRYQCITGEPLHRDESSQPWTILRRRHPVAGMYWRDARPGCAIALDPGRRLRAVPNQPDLAS